MTKYFLNQSMDSMEALGQVCKLVVSVKSYKRLAPAWKKIWQCQETIKVLDFLSLNVVTTNHKLWTNAKNAIKLPTVPLPLTPSSFVSGLSFLGIEVFYWHNPLFSWFIKTYFQPHLPRQVFPNFNYSVRSLKGHLLFGEAQILAERHWKRQKNTKLKF